MPKMTRPILPHPILIIAEKPSVARDIAKVVGASSGQNGYFEGNGYTVSWAIGHLVTLPEPHEINPDWKGWRTDTLPMIPEVWPLKVIDRTKAQFNILKGLLKTCREVICATDAGREGELIFRYIYEAAKCKKPVKRLWISSLTRDAISAGLQNLQSSAAYDGLSDAARGRSCADWLIGMNLSRAYAIMSAEPFFVGRVQTPTLAMIVNREHEIQNFKPENYYEIVGKFLIPDHRGDSSSDRLAMGSSVGADSFGRNKPAIKPTAPAPNLFEGNYLGEQKELPKQGYIPIKRLPPDLKSVQNIVDRLKIGTARVKSIDAKNSNAPPPLLYDLTELQRHGNRLYGLSASRTLEIAQALYERHKLISYPRTDSNYLSQSVANTLPKIVNVIRGPYEKDLAESTGKKPLGARYINDAGVSDHHAIIPTDISSQHLVLTTEERKIYDLICRRLLAAYQDDYVTSISTALTEVTSLSTSPPKESLFTTVTSGARSTTTTKPKASKSSGGTKKPAEPTAVSTLAATSTPPSSATRDIFRSVGIMVVQRGWKKLEASPYFQSGSAPNSLNSPNALNDKLLPSTLKANLSVNVAEVIPELKKTKAPPHLNDATLLTAMETAGKSLDDKELAAILKESGLGTPATRAGMIETLLNRKYIERQAKSLVATDLGIRLIARVHQSVKSPELTARWERELTQIQNNKRTLKEFMTALENELRENLKLILAGAPPRRVPPTNGPPQKAFQVTLTSEKETQITEDILNVLISTQATQRTKGGVAAGRIFEQIVQNQPGLDRREFEYVLHLLEVVGRVQVSHQKFEKNGQTISYRKISLNSGLKDKDSVCKTKRPEI
jgi:DNA topoisomerase-3